MRCPVGRTGESAGVGAGFIMADCHLVAYRAAAFNPGGHRLSDCDNRESVATHRHGIPDRSRHAVEDLLDKTREVEVLYVRRAS